MGEYRLEGGFDGGAILVGGTVRRVAGPWSVSVARLLAHLRDQGFNGAPLPMGSDELGRDIVTYLPGQTVGSQRPWPVWTHSDQALVQVAGWLRRFHEAILDFDPGIDAVWREGGFWRPGLVIGHNDAAPYNAVWDEDGLVGFMDGRGDYGGDLTTDGLFEVLRLRLREKVEAIRTTAGSGDTTYRGCWITAPTDCFCVLSKSWTRCRPRRARTVPASALTGRRTLPPGRRVRRETAGMTRPGH
jgi:hypothetical protein